MRWWGSKHQSGIDQVLDYAAYCYVILPRHPCYSSTCRSYHTGSSTHLGVPHLRPSISSYHTRSFSHLYVSCLRPIIPTDHPATPPPYSSYFMVISPNLLLLLVSREIPTKVAQSCFCFTSWRHQDSLLFPPPFYPLSLAHTLNSDINATHYASVAFCIHI